MKQPQDNKTVDLVDAAATSPRGRKPMPAAEVIDVQIDDAALQRDNQAATALAVRQEVIAQTFGDGLAYERERVVHEAQFYLQQSAGAMLEAGKRLIQIKEHEPHGEFTTIVTEQLGMGERSARLMMAAAAKYLSPRLESKRQALSVLGRSKMFDLMTEADEDIEALVDGGTLAGHTFDDIEAMSARELKAALRDHKQQLAAKDKVIAERSAKVDKLEERLHKPFKPAKGSEFKTKEEHDDINELREAMTAAELAFMRLSLVVSTITERSESEAVNKAAGDALAYLVARIRDNVNNNQLMLDTSDEAFGLAPSWK
jgi:hypothetical protein